jgi:TolB protein
MRVTAGNQVIEALHVSADGEWLVFDSNRAGNQDIYKVAVAGGDPAQLTTHQSNDYSPAWSPDGDEIAFYSLRNGNRDIFVISSDGTGLQQVTEHASDDIEPDWSPDGNQLVFFSDRTGRYEVYIVSRPDGESTWETPRQLTFDGGQHAKWSPDGRFIAYVFTARLKVVSPDGSGDRVLYFTDDPESIPWAMYCDWSADGKAVIFKGLNRARASSIWSMPVDGDTPKPLVLFTDPAFKSARSEFTTDGRSLFFTITEMESDIWRLELLREKQ